MIDMWERKGVRAVLNPAEIGMKIIWLVTRMVMLIVLAAVIWSLAT
jgi:hypothetical protein